MDPSPTRSPKLLTVEEANACLPQVRAILTQLRGLERSIAHADRQLDAVAAKLSTGNGHPVQALNEERQAHETRRRELLEAFQAALKHLESLGGFLKDLTLGLVDFHSLREGNTVFLCWKTGEPRVQYWHPLDTGFDDRRPLA